MSAQRTMGLVVEGSPGRSFAARAPSLLTHLGPVKGMSFATARKLVSRFRAGYAVPDYAALEGCALVWIAVPEASLDAAIADLAGQAWVSRASFIFCQTVRESSSAHLLRKRGAKLASLNEVGEPRHTWLVAEGHREALGALRQMCAAAGRRLIPIRSGTKADFLAGVHLATDLLRPWLAGSAQCLRAAGFRHADAVELTTMLGARAVRGYRNAPSAPLSGPARAELERALGDSALMAKSGKKRSELYAEGIRRALEFAPVGRAKGTHA